MPFWRILSAIVCAVCLSSTSAHAATPAGTKIVNQASTFFDDVDGRPVEIQSNLSSVSVATVYQFTLDADHELQTTAGERVSFVHLLHNTGNDEAQFDVLVESINTNESADELIDLILYRDLNKNGLIDPTDSIIDNTISLLADEAVQLIATAIVPVHAPDNSEFELLLHAKLLDSELPEKSNSNRIQVLDTPKLNINLASSLSCEQEQLVGSEFSVTMSSSNQSNVLPESGSIYVDGALKEGVLLHLELPDQLSLTPNAIPQVFAYQAIPIIQSGLFNDEWMRIEHWNGSSHIDRIGLLIPAENFTLDERLGVEFPLMVVEKNYDSLIEVNALLDINADGIGEQVSDAVCVNIGLPAAAFEQVIRFIEPTKQLQRSGITPVFSSDSHFDDAFIYNLYSHEKLHDASSFEDAANASVFKVGESYSLALNGIYLELQTSVPSEQIILDSNSVRHVFVNLSSELTSDYSSVLLREVTPGASVYRSVRPILLSNELSADGANCPGGNGVVTSIPNFDSDDDVCALLSDIDDRLLVSFENAETGDVIEDRARVQPVSRVFDSTTLLPVPGATVTLMQENIVVKHPINGKAISVVSDQDGRFSLPQLELGSNYSIAVVPPENFIFPSTVGKEKFSQLSVVDASYGEAGFNQQISGRFSIHENEPTPVINVPLDPVNRNALLVLEKSVNTGSVEPGDTAVYSIELSNNGNGELDNLSVIDTPAFGLRYVEGSATFGDDAIPDPVNLTKEHTSVNESSLEFSQNLIAEKPESGLYFSLQSLPAGESKLLKYKMRVSAVAEDGTGINVAAANATTASGLVLATEQSRASVEIKRSGVLSDAASVFGKVFVDSSCDFIQNKAEWPIAGVRLYLQDGSFVTTDADGLFSVYDLEPGLHVIRLDESTLPDGLELKPLSVANAADPRSRFLDLSNGDFHRADFAASCPKNNAQQVFDEIQARSERYRNQSLLLKAQKYNPDSTARASDARQRADTDGDLSTGWLDKPENDDQLNADGSVVQGAPLLTESNQGLSDGLSDASKAQLSTATSLEVMGDPKVLAQTITGNQAKQGDWLWPTTSISRDGRFMVVVPAGVDPVLFVNDEAVAQTQLGEQIVNRSAQAQLLAWYGVKLRPGLNQIEVRAVDAFGNNRVLATKKVQRPAAGVRLKLSADQNTLPADAGKSVMPIKIEIFDKYGNHANGVYFVSINSTGGSIIESDLQKLEPGVQVRIDNGIAVVHLRSSELPGSVLFSATVGPMHDSLELIQVAYARELFGVGLIDVGGQWNKVSGAAEQEQVLDSALTGYKTKKRVALFMKGRIKNDINMTLSYDSDKRRSYDVFNDLNPNEHYATYGDGSTRGFEAQSTSKLYLKLEKDSNSIMWGDYLTDNASDKNDLARQQRSLTGINAIYAKGHTKVQLYAAMQESQRSTEEIAGNGTALLYKLDGAPIARNSDVVEKIVRDRNNTSVILSIERLYRYSDYTIEYATGVVYFNDVVPSFDQDLNPVSVRFIYDKSSNIDEHAVAGLRLQHKINEFAQVNLSLSDDQNPLSGSRLSGVQLHGQLGFGTRYSLSAAHQSHTVASRGDGVAQRIQLEHQWQGAARADTSITWSKANANFDNPSAGVTTGREAWQFVHRQILPGALRGEIDANYDESVDGDDRLASAGVTVEKTYKNWSLKSGLRHVQNRVPTQSYRFNTALVGVTKRFVLPFERRGSIGVEYERDIKVRKRFRFGVRSELSLHDKLNVYANYELVNGFSSQSFLLGQQASRLFTAGLESPLTSNTKLYSEYRFRRASGVHNLETASGVRGHYEIEPGLSISPAFEYIDVLEGETNEDSIAVSFGIKDTRVESRKISLQAELRHTEQSRYFGFRGSVVQQLGLNWTGLLREEFTRKSPDVGQLSSSHRFTVGLARRPKEDNRHHSLYLANWKENYGPEDGMDKRTYLLSTHQNFQINRSWVVSGRLGGKWQRTRFEDHNAKASFMLGDFRSTFDLHRRWEVDFRAGWLSGKDFDDARYSWGAGVSWIANRNTRLALHYNVVGFKEEDLDEQGYNAQGLNIGLQVKFDEDWFKWLE